MSNTIKWKQIPLTIQYLFDGFDVPRDQLNAVLFEEPCTVTHKFDGTNVGKDEHGTRYGRNQIIPSHNQSYCSTTLADVNKLDVKQIKSLVCEAIALEPSKIYRFCLYGELMCNKGLYDYATKKIASTHQVFGAMVQPSDPADMFEMAQKFRKAGFACRFHDVEDYDDVEGDEPADEPFMVLMNEKLRKIVESQNVSVVPIAGKGSYPNIYSMMLDNYDHLFGGYGEGVIITFAPTINRPRVGTDAETPEVIVETSTPPPTTTEEKSCKPMKWKNGSEGSANNNKHLDTIMEELEKDVNNTLFGTNTTRAKELLTKLKEVENSHLINGQQIKKKAKGKPVKVALSFSEKELEMYEPAIKSARSKFDYAETFFEQKAGQRGGPTQYSQLIAVECLTDIAVDKTDPQVMKRHNDLIFSIIKQEFITWCKNKNNQPKK